MAYGTIMGQTPRGGGKRYATVVVGTSTAGWTTADCDFLCDGTDDQVEIQAAINQIMPTGGEIKILNGNYNITDDVNVNPSNSNTGIYFNGNGENTTLSFNNQEINFYCYSKVGNIFYFNNLGLENCQVDCTDSQEIGFYNCFLTNVYYQGTSGINLSVKDCYILVKNNTLNDVGFSGGTILNGSSIIANNIIDIQDTMTTSYFINLNANNRNNVSNNNVIYSSTSSQEYDFMIVRDGVISNNCFDNCSILGNNSIICGNYFLNGNATVLNTSIFSDNIIENGMLSVNEFATISGNTIIQNQSKPCIEVYKTNNAEEITNAPNITGNICQNGSIGIYLSSPTNSLVTNKAKKNACITGNTCTNSNPLQIDNNWSDCLITGNMFPNGPITDNGSSNTKANNVTG